MILDIEFADGSSVRWTVADQEEADEAVWQAGKADMIVSAWRDEEPWFGQCTDMREGTP